MTYYLLPFSKWKDPNINVYHFKEQFILFSKLFYFLKAGAYIFNDTLQNNRFSF